jgi:transposase-like protein
LEEEVNAFLGRHRYARSRQFRGYRNGYHQARELTVGLAAVEVRVPRVSQAPQEVAPQGFRSQVVERYQRTSQTTQRLFARLYPSASSGQLWKGWPPETLSRCFGSWWERLRPCRPTRWCV